jgi:hypothetical protein
VIRVEKIMRSANYCAVVWAAIVLLAAGGVAVAADAFTFAAPQFVIEDLEAPTRDDIVLVRGRIRNNGDMPVRGYVLIHFKNGDNGIIGSVESAVNEHRPIGRGESGPFEEYVNISGIRDIKTVSVEFITD